MKAMISSSSKIMVNKYAEDKGMSSLSKYLCMNKPEVFFLKNNHQKLPQLELTCVERNNMTLVSSSTHHAELDTSEREIQELYEPKTVHVRIQLQKECSFGEHFCIVGDDPIFGLWEPSEAVPLNWSDGHIWTVELDIPIGKSIHFKFILKERTGTILWQPGPDRVFSTWETNKTIIVCVDWENAEMQEILEEESAVFGNSISESADASGMYIVADILSHPVEKPVPHASIGSTSTENESTMSDKLLAENITLEEKPLAIVAEDVRSSYDNPLVKARSNAPQNNEVKITAEETEDVSINNASESFDTIGNHGKASTTNELDFEANSGNIICHVGDPVLVPGLTPLPTELFEASIPNDDPKSIDDSSTDDHKSILTLQKQQPNNMQSQELNAQNVPELEGTQKAEEVIHQAETTEKFIEQEQSDHEPEEPSHLTVKENSNPSLFDNNVLHNDIQWGRNTLQKLLSNLGLV